MRRPLTVILPVPFDKTSTWLKGADKGPAAIIEASRYLEFYDIETDSEVFKKGIFTAKPVNAVIFFCFDKENRFSSFKVS